MLNHYARSFCRWPGEDPGGGGGGGPGGLDAPFLRWFCLFLCPKSLPPPLFLENNCHPPPPPPPFKIPWSAPDGTPQLSWRGVNLVLSMAVGVAMAPPPFAIQGAPVVDCLAAFNFHNVILDKGRFLTIIGVCSLSKMRQSHHYKIASYCSAEGWASRHLVTPDTCFW